jgi:predicted O-methyltransferase YrrM
MSRERPGSICYSSIYLLEAIADQDDGHLLTIERARPEYERACLNLRAYRDQCTIVCANATEFIHSLSSERFDLIFIDALKSATLEQFRKARTIVKPGGTIIIDDVVKWRAKMEDFYQYLETENIAHETVMTDPDDGVMVIRF